MIPFIEGKELNMSPQTHQRMCRQRLLLTHLKLLPWHLSQIKVWTLIRSKSRSEPSRCGPVGMFQVIVLLLHKQSVQEATLPLSPEDSSADDRNH